ncbi:hypothetical protein IG631_05155 [Alternaria alternata]|nr:hypothetical protein IG631_05155 [Alternaria alternata]
MPTSALVSLCRLPYAQQRSPLQSGLTWTRWLPSLAARRMSQARGSSTVDVSILPRLLRRRIHSHRSSRSLQRVTCIGTVTHATKVYE